MFISVVPIGGDDPEPAGAASAQHEAAPASVGIAPSPFTLLFCPFPRAMLCSPMQTATIP
jgi:hypothetical protein